MADSATEAGLRTIVVIGGVAGGAGAAVKARRTDEAVRIVMFEKGPYVSYANCGIPYYVGNDIEDRDELLLRRYRGAVRGTLQYRRARELRGRPH